MDQRLLKARAGLSECPWDGDQGANSGGGTESGARDVARGHHALKVVVGSTDVHQAVHAMGRLE